MARERIVKPTIHRYSIVDKETGNRENLKDVICTYYHNGIVELQTIANDFLVYECNKVLIEKY